MQKFENFLKEAKNFKQKIIEEIHTQASVVSSYIHHIYNKDKNFEYIVSKIDQWVGIGNECKILEEDDMPPENITCPVTYVF